MVAGCAALFQRHCSRQSRANPLGCGSQAGKSQREIAIDLFGAARVEAEWSIDSQMRAKVRRLVHGMRATSGGGPGGAGPGMP